MVSDTLERYLQPQHVLRSVYARMVPHLMFLDFVKVIREDASTFPYSYNAYSMSSDPKKETAPVAMAGGRFPELDYTRESIGSAATEEHGFQMRLKHDMMKHRGSKAAQEVINATERAGFWMAETLNSAILTAMTGGATTPTWTPTATWDDGSGTATPIEDLEKFDEAFEQAGYPYRFTDGFLHSTNWHELKRFVLNYDNRYLVGGVPSITKDTIEIPSVDVLMHKVDKGLTAYSEGYLLGLDRNNLVTEFHYYTDPLFAPASVSYQTVDESGKTVTKTVNNLGIHFRRIDQKELDDIVLQFYYDAKVLVTNAYGLNYDSGI